MLFSIRILTDFVIHFFYYSDANYLLTLMEIWFLISYGSECYLSKLSVLSVLFLSVLRWLAEILSVLCFQFLWHHLFAYNDQARIVISVLFGISGLVFYVLILIVFIIRACTSGFQYLCDNSSLVCNIYVIISSLILTLCMLLSEHFLVLYSNEKLKGNLSQIF